MDVQYFDFDKAHQTAAQHASQVASYISDALDVFGEAATEQASTAGQKQVSSQHANHEISGTLVFSVNCTHKTARVFAPFILDVDKAVHSWNQMYPGELIKTDSVTEMAKIEAQSETSKDSSFNIISGATYGSCFIGMVHVLDSSSTDISQNMESIANTLQEQFKVGRWFSDESGGFGMDSSFSKSAKNLLSTQNIQAHCSAIAVGIIPSIRSNQVKMAVQQFAEFDPGKDMQRLATLQGVTADESNTVASSATAARTGQQMVALQNAKITSALSSLAVIDDGANNIVDTNSLMVAMDDYIQKCIAGGDNVGVPINYFLKPITRSMIARAWLAKYYPNNFNQAGAADDSKKNDDEDKKA